MEQRFNMGSINQLQQALDYTFTDFLLLKRALTHRSLSRENYERLEFVGDGILDYVVALNLYQLYPHLSEGSLSKIRAALVNQDSLVELANSISLGDYLFLGDGEEKSSGRSRPSILADVLEAIFAAVSLDSSFLNAKKVIEKLYREKLINAEDLVLKDSKSLLQEYLQGHKINVPDYTVVELSGPDHASIFKVECIIPELDIKVLAQGRSKKEASQLVAEKVLSSIKERNMRGK